MGIYEGPVGGIPSCSTGASYPCTNAICLDSSNLWWWYPLRFSWHLSARLLPPIHLPSSPSSASHFPHPPYPHPQQVERHHVPDAGKGQGHDGRCLRALGLEPPLAIPDIPTINHRPAAHSHHERARTREKRVCAPCSAAIASLALSLPPPRWIRRGWPPISMPDCARALSRSGP